MINQNDKKIFKMKLRKPFTKLQISKVCPKLILVKETLKLKFLIRADSIWVGGNVAISTKYYTS